MFFDDINGRQYPVSRIVRVVVNKGIHVQVEGVEGSVEISDETSRQLNALGPVVPAHSNTFILYPDGRSEDRMVRSPVVAWMIGPDLIARPITPEGLRDGIAMGDLTLEASGVVLEIGGGGYWPDVRTFLREQPLPPSKSVPIDDEPIPF